MYQKGYLSNLEKDDIVDEIVKLDLVSADRGLTFELFIQRMESLFGFKIKEVNQQQHEEEIEF